MTYQETLAGYKQGKLANDPKKCSHFFCPEGEDTLDKDDQFIGQREFCIECGAKVNEEFIPGKNAADEKINLPALQGSEKQIKWASDIRQEAIVWGEQMLAGMAAKPDNPPEYLIAVREIFYSVVSDHKEARFWIDQGGYGKKFYQQTITSEMATPINTKRKQMRTAING